MAKNCRLNIHESIENQPFSREKKVALNDIYHSIFDDIRSNNNFNYYKGSLFPKDQRFAQASAFLSNINRIYDEKVVSFMKNPVNPTQYLVKIDINHLLRDFKESSNIKEENNLISKERNKKDPYIRYKYFRNSSITTDKDILTKIANSSHPLANMAKNLLPYTKGTEIELIPGGPFEGKYAGLYYNVQNKIKISEDSIFRGIGSEPLIIHEILHSLTLGELERNVDLYNQLNQYFQIAKTSINSNYYALSNIDEFIVGLFTDGAFINELRKLPPLGNTYKNFFQEVLDNILQMFKVSTSDRSLYSEVFSLASNVIESDKQFWDEGIRIHESFEKNYVPLEDQEFINIDIPCQ